MEFHGLVCCLCLTAKTNRCSVCPFSCKAMSLSRSFGADNRKVILTKSRSSRKGVTVRRWQHCSSPGSGGASPAWTVIGLPCEQCLCDCLPRPLALMTYSRGGGLPGPSALEAGRTWSWGCKGETAGSLGGDVEADKCGVFNTCEMTHYITVPGRETGSASASARQLNSFLPPPARCSGYYMSHEPLKELVIFWRKICVEDESSYLGITSVSERYGRYKLRVSGWVLIYTVLEGNRSRPSL